MTEPSVSGALAAPFVEGLTQRELRFQRCMACNRAQTLARYACAHCGSTQLVWEAAAGSGTVHAVTVVGRAPSDDFRAWVPYTLVLVTLDEGPRLMAHAAAGVRIGDRVDADFFVHRDRVLVRFRPSSG